MISRTRPDAGFTLLEVLVVVLLLGLVAGIVLQRGPVRSATLDLRAAGGEISRTLRLARSRAIATNQATMFRMDVPGHAFAVDGGAVRRLPDSFAISLVSVAPGGGGSSGISFAPDGSSSGGRIGLAQGGRSIEVDVAWLTGRVSLSPLRSIDAR